MLIIGSEALQYHLDRWKDAQDFHYQFFESVHKQHDKDCICTIQEYERYVKKVKNDGMLEEATPKNSGASMYVKLNDHRWDEKEHNEFYIAWPGTTNETILESDEYVEDVEGTRYASLNMLLLLKLSHRYKKNSPHFKKTMYSIRLLREMGAHIPKELRDLLAAREKETYTYAHPKLNKMKADFFNEADSFYKYEHDDIHQAVKVGDAPAYTAFAKAGQEVKSSKKMWEKCDHLTRLRAGLEESYVLAVERSLVPHPGVLTRRAAFDKALEKVCTSITSGWFREFCWENYDGISALYDDQYFDKFNDALQRGQIKEYKRD